MAMMTNPYKRQDIFLCTHDAHTAHGNRVSVIHTIRKGCFPHGCTYFRWKCVELERRKKCFRGYSHVGRNCPGCRFFDEEKMSRTLIQLRPSDFDDFLDDLHSFEEWIRDHEDKEHECYGVVRSVKPHLKQRYTPASRHRPEQASALLKGFVIGFENFFVGRTALDDATFAVIGRDMQSRHSFRAGDRVEFKAVLTLDQGRIVMQRLRGIRFLDRGHGKVWTSTDSLVGRAAGRTLLQQAEKCVACDQGLLIDVTDVTSDEIFHRIFCLAGMPSAAACTVPPEGDLHGQTCANRFTAIATPSL